MTAAYVSGVHEGSSGRIAIAPRSFPGYGGADRLASVEIPTVRRSRDQLIQVDLQPFFSVTGNAADPSSVAEGFLVGHIRYQGFQGENPRLTTKPSRFAAGWFLAGRRPSTHRRTGYRSGSPPAPSGKGTNTPWSQTCTLGAGSPA